MHSSSCTALQFLPVRGFHCQDYYNWFVIHNTYYHVIAESVFNDFIGERTCEKAMIFR